MTASQPRRRAAAVWRAIRDERAVMWELFWQPGRVPADRAGPLAWAPSLDGPRLTGNDLPHPRRRQHRAQAMTATSRLGPSAADAAAAQPGQRLERA